jgi:hypothetical protein
MAILAILLRLASFSRKKLSDYQFSRDLAQFEVSETALSNASTFAIRFRLGQITEGWRLFEKTTKRNPRFRRELGER